MIWGKYSQMNAPSRAPAHSASSPDPRSASSARPTSTIKIPTFGFNLTLSPTFLIDGVFGYTKFKNMALGPDYGKNWGSEVWGIPGTNGGKAFAGRHPLLRPAVYRQRLHLVGQLLLVESELLRRPQLHLHHQLLEGEGRARIPVGRRHRAPRAEPLAA